MNREKQEELVSIASGLRILDSTLTSLIDCGDFGCVFHTDKPGIVVKIGSQWSEYRLARTILSQNLSHPSLPLIYGVVDLREALGIPYYAIIREDIPDIINTDVTWLDERLADLEHRAEDADSSDEIFSMAAEILENEPGKPSDELLFEQAAELTAWCYDRHILLGDMLASNFGQTEIGAIKLRDLGGTKFLKN